MAPWEANHYKVIVVLLVSLSIFLEFDTKTGVFISHKQTKFEASSYILFEMSLFLAKR